MHQKQYYRAGPPLWCPSELCQNHLWTGDDLPLWKQLDLLWKWKDEVWLCFKLQNTSIDCWVIRFCAQLSSCTPNPGEPKWHTVDCSLLTNQTQCSSLSHCIGVPHIACVSEVQDRMLNYGNCTLTFSTKVTFVLRYHRVPGYLCQFPNVWCQFFVLENLSFVVLYSVDSLAIPKFMKVSCALELRVTLIWVAMWPMLNDFIDFEMSYNVLFRGKKALFTFHAYLFVCRSNTVLEQYCNRIHILPQQQGHFIFLKTVNAVNLVDSV